MSDIGWSFSAAPKSSDFNLGAVFDNNLEQRLSVTLATPPSTGDGCLGGLPDGLRKGRCFFFCERFFDLIGSEGPDERVFALVDERVEGIGQRDVRRKIVFEKDGKKIFEIFEIFEYKISHF